MSAFDLLKADHKKVSELFKKLEATSERGLKKREDLFQQLQHELQTHSEIEETIFYPALQEAAETRSIVLESLEEHNVVKDLLMQLDSTPKNSEEWMAKLAVLKENVERHVKEEETQLFPKARKVLSNDEIKELGEDLEEAKFRYGMVVH